MPEKGALIRRLEVLEQEGSAAALARLEKGISAIQDKQEGHNTALGKIIMLLEETRLRGSEIERAGGDQAMRLDRVEMRTGRIENEIIALRRDLPTIVADAVRDALRERSGN